MEEDEVLGFTAAGGDALHQGSGKSCKHWILVVSHQT